MKRTLTKLMAGSAAVALLVSAQPVLAQCCPQPDPCCNPCTDWCDMCGAWEFGAHALYWTPIGCPYTYAVSDPGAVNQVQSGAASTISCEADWGVRVFAGYQGDCTFLTASYHWFESKLAAERIAASLRVQGLPVAVPGIPAKAPASQRIRYQTFDLRWGRDLYRSCGCEFYLFGNVKWVDLSLSRAWKYFITSQVQSVNLAATRTSTLQGGAVGLGAGARFDVWCNFGLFGDFNALGVIAERATKDVVGTSLIDTQPAQSAQVFYPSDTCINPEMNFRLGIDYTWTCGCWTFVGELGYELDYFWNAFALPAIGSVSPQEEPSSWILQCQDVGFSGLFFGGKILF